MKNTIKVLKILSFCLAFLYNDAIAKNIKLIPGSEGYERYMNNKDLEESLHNQRSWMLSAFFPGVGQMYNGRTFRGLLFIASIASLGAGALYCHSKYTKYSHPGTLDSSDYSSYANIRDGLILGAALIYLINIFDAYVCAKLSKFELTKNISVEVVPDIDVDKAAGVAIKMNFDPAAS